MSGRTGGVWAEREVSGSESESLGGSERKCG